MSPDSGISRISGISGIERFTTRGGTIVRLSPWRGDSRTTQVVAVDGPPPCPDDVAELVDHLGSLGVREVMTTALGPLDQQSFSARGFIPHEHLLLLHRPVDPGNPPSRPAPTSATTSAHTRRARARDRVAVLELDDRAFAPFSPFWRFDAGALIEAEQATESHRRRVVRQRARGGMGATVIGHAITGRTATIGFLQRLAVEPTAEGRGIGSALVADALRWLGRTGAREAWVNTQPDNDRARALYLRHGFTERGAGLDVLRRVIGDSKEESVGDPER